jgi:hypothetical protein
LIPALTAAWRLPTFRSTCPWIGTSYGPIRVMLIGEAVGNDAGAAGHTPDEHAPSVSTGVL